VAFPLKKRIWISALCLLGLAAVVLIVLNSRVFKRQDTWQATELSIPVISTRDHFQDGKLSTGRSAYDYELIDNPSSSSFWDDSAEDAIIVIHGFNNSAEKASIKFNTAELSLHACGYDGLIVGFSWDANTQKDPFGTTGYREGRSNAVANGTKLASFIADCRERKPGLRIHLIGYSMGARIALESLLALDVDPDLAALDLQVDSVHLVGAAVDNDEVELRKRYGTAIERRTQWLYNYYSREDNSLGMFYPLKEGDRALGESGIEHRDRAPANYRGIDIEAELISYDRDGRPDAEPGDNHSGCLGNLAADGSLLDDGIMDVVVGQIEGQTGQSSAGALPESAPDLP
jgi:pimeloyl-ACP methyl ester carboxylesterase